MQSFKLFGLLAVLFLISFSSCDDDEDSVMEETFANEFVIGTQTNSIGTVVDVQFGVQDDDSPDENVHWITISRQTVSFNEEQGLLQFDAGPENELVFINLFTSTKDLADGTYPIIGINDPDPDSDLNSAYVTLTSTDGESLVFDDEVDVETNAGTLEIGTLGTDRTIILTTTTEDDRPLTVEWRGTIATFDGEEE